MLQAKEGKRNLVEKNDSLHHHENQVIPFYYRVYI